MIVGAYTLDCYCDNVTPGVNDSRHEYGEFPHQYVHEYGSVCRKRARADGWLFKRDGKTFCPKCSGK